MQGTIDIERLIDHADTEFPALYQLFAGYFHEDWTEDHVSADAAVDAYKSEAPVGAVHDAIVEAAKVLELRLSDGDLERLLIEGFECNYLPERDGMVTRSWFEHVRDRLLPDRPGLRTVPGS